MKNIIIAILLMIIAYMMFNNYNSYMKYNNMSNEAIVDDIMDNYDVDSKTMKQLLAIGVKGKMAEYEFNRRYKIINR